MDTTTGQITLLRGPSGQQRRGMLVSRREIVRTRELLMSITTTTSNAAARPIPCDEALAIARKDAEAVYRDLSGFRIIIEQRVDGWHVDYELSDIHIKGGGPHYVIDTLTGTIVSKRYEQ